MSETDLIMQGIMDRLKAKRLELDYSYQDLASLTGMSKSTLQRYETGEIKNIPLSKLKIMAVALQTTPEWLLGWNEKETSSQIIEFDSEYLRRIPLFGRTAAGSPMIAIENPGEYIVVDTRINKVNGNQIDEFYALEVAGQSMEPTIHDGEVVLVRKQPEIETGQIGVFRCNGDEATIKRFVREGGKYYLIPDNKQYPALEYTEECVCIGKVLESIRRKLK